MNTVSKTQVQLTPHEVHFLSTAHCIILPCPSPNVVIAGLPDLSVPVSLVSTPTTVVIEKLTVQIDMQIDDMYEHVAQRNLEILEQKFKAIEQPLPELLAFNS